MRTLSIALLLASGAIAQETWVRFFNLDGFTVEGVRLQVVPKQGAPTPPDPVLSDSYGVASLATEGFAEVEASYEGQVVGRWIAERELGDRIIAPPSKVEGRILLANGDHAPGPWWVVLRSSCGDTPPVSAIRDEVSGEFRFAEVFPGNYTLVARTSECYGLSLFSTPFEVEEEDHFIDLRYEGLDPLNSVGLSLSTDEWRRPPEVKVTLVTSAGEEFPALITDDMTRIEFPAGRIDMIKVTDPDFKATEAHVIAGNVSLCFIPKNASAVVFRAGNGRYAPQAQQLRPAARERLRSWDRSSAFVFEDVLENGRVGFLDRPWFAPVAFQFDPPTREMNTMKVRLPGTRAVNVHLRHRDGTRLQEGIVELGHCEHDVWGSALNVRGKGFYFHIDRIKCVPVRVTLPSGEVFERTIEPHEDYVTLYVPDR